MAGQLPGFLSGSMLAIRIGRVNVAYAQALTFQDNMTVVPVGGIGSYQNHALEPTGYMARGSLTIIQYSTQVLNAMKPTNATASTVDKNYPANIKETSASLAGSPGSIIDGSGNSLLRASWFSPGALIISSTFDIDVYERTVSNVLDPAVDTVQGRLIYRLENCRLTNYSVGWQPGSLVQETVQYMATRLVDYSSQWTAQT